MLAFMRVRRVRPFPYGSVSGVFESSFAHGGMTIIVGVTP